MSRHAQKLRFWGQCHAPLLELTPFACSLPAAVFCGYTKCECDGTCPIVNGVSLGYMLEKLT